jgi:hypothetical protein
LSHFVSFYDKEENTDFDVKEKSKTGQFLHEFTRQTSMPKLEKAATNIANVTSYFSQNYYLAFAAFIVFILVYVLDPFNVKRGNESLRAKREWKEIQEYLNDKNSNDPYFKPNI